MHLFREVRVEHVVCFSLQRLVPEIIISLAGAETAFRHDPNRRALKLTRVATV